MTDSDISVVTVAKTPFDAQVIAGVLRGADIPVYVGGRMLTDEFALAQALANLQRVEVKVPTSRLDDARNALKAADESAKLLDDPDFDPGEGSVTHRARRSRRGRHPR